MTWERQRNDQDTETRRGRKVKEREGKPKQWAQASWRKPDGPKHRSDQGETRYYRMRADTDRQIDDCDVERNTGEVEATITRLLGTYGFATRWIQDQAESIFLHRDGC